MNDQDVMVNRTESCRHETTKDPRHEPCRFCARVFNTWRNLSSHLARHLEDIALPLIGLLMDDKDWPLLLQNTEKPMMRKGTIDHHAFPSQSQHLTVANPSLTSAYNHDTRYEITPSPSYIWTGNQPAAAKAQQNIQPVVHHPSAVTYPPLRPKTSLNDNNNNNAADERPLAYFADMRSASPREMVTGFYHGSYFHQFSNPIGISVQDHQSTVAHCYPGSVAAPMGTGYVGGGGGFYSNSYGYQL